VAAAGSGFGASIAIAEVPGTKAEGGAIMESKKTPIKAPKQAAQKLEKKAQPAIRNLLMIRP
jgi:hypothetical protein